MTGTPGTPMASTADPLPFEARAGGATRAELARLEELLVSSRALPGEAVALARALGPDASGRVVADVIEAWSPSNPGGAALRAGLLAAELGLAGAAAPLARHIARWGVNLTVTRHATAALSRLGPAGADAALELLHGATEKIDRLQLATALARAGRDDERIRAHLVRMLTEFPLPAASLLMERGDWRAVPELLRAFDALARDPIGDCVMCAADDLSAIATAVAALGGELSGEQAMKLHELLDRADAMMADRDADPSERAPRPSVVRPPRPGRNDPCPCGSGKKYKHCCLDADAGDPRH